MRLLKGGATEFRVTRCLKTSRLAASCQPAPGTPSRSAHAFLDESQVAQAWRGANSPYKHGPPRQPVVGDGVALQPTLHTSHGLFTDLDASGSQSPSSPGGQYTQKYVSDLVAQVRVAAMAPLVPGVVHPISAESAAQAYVNPWQQCQLHAGVGVRFDGAIASICLALLVPRAVPLLPMSHAAAAIFHRRCNTAAELWRVLPCRHILF